MPESSTGYYPWDNVPYDWNWGDLSENVSMEEVRANPREMWDRYHLSDNPGITLWDVKNLDLPEATGRWNWYYLSMNVPIEDVRQNPELPWEGEGLSENEGITVEDVKYLDIHDDEWCWYVLSLNVPIEDIRENPDLPWNEIALPYRQDNA